MSTPQTTRLFDGKKFAWDGRVYDSRAAAQSIADRYQRDGFEVRVVEGDGSALVYTRRVVRMTTAMA